MTTTVDSITAYCADAEPWTDKEARNLTATAYQCLWDEYHRNGHYGDNSQLSRENCASCVLAGYEPRGGYGDGYSVKRDGPNYAGWARVYVEARQAVPVKWEAAFWNQLHSDNEAYANALKRSVKTFGIRFV